MEETRRFMKILKQIAIIWAVTLAGELLSALIPLSIPAGVYGLVLMLVLLLTGVIKLEQVERAGLFLVEIMPVMFIPAAAGLLDTWDSLRQFAVPFLITITLITWLVMALSGKLTQALMKREGKDQ